jgi:hypothetical protein
LQAGEAADAGDEEGAEGAEGKASHRCKKIEEDNLSAAPQPTKGFMAFYLSCLSSLIGG